MLNTSIQKPIQIQEFKTVIRDLSDEELGNTRAQIENSKRHLSRTIERLERYIKKLKGEESSVKDDLDNEIESDNIDINDLQLFQDSLRENERVVSNLEERLHALEEEMVYRGTRRENEIGISNDIAGARPSAAKMVGVAVDSDNSAVDATAPNSYYL